MMLIETPQEVAARVAGTKQADILKALAEQPGHTLSTYKVGLLCSLTTARKMRDDQLIVMDTGSKFGGSHRGTVSLAPRGKSVCFALKYL